jgi:hypothetical protein
MPHLETKHPFRTHHIHLGLGLCADHAQPSNQPCRVSAPQRDKRHRAALCAYFSRRRNRKLGGRSRNGFGLPRGHELGPSLARTALWIRCFSLRFSLYNCIQRQDLDDGTFMRLDWNRFMATFGFELPIQTVAFITTVTICTITNDDVPKQVSRRTRLDLL